MSSEPRPVSRALLIFGGFVSLVSFIIGSNITFGCIKWLIALNGETIEPPGHMVGIIPVGGVILGGLLTAMGLFGLWAVRRLWRRA